MKHALAGVLVAAMIFTAAGFAYSTQRSGVTPAQFAALAKRVKKLEQTNKALVGYIGGCLLTWKSITQYSGYVYNTSSGQGTTTALDFTESGGQASGFVPFTTDQSCTTSTPRVFK